MNLMNQILLLKHWIISWAFSAAKIEFLHSTTSRASTVYTYAGRELFFLLLSVFSLNSITKLLPLCEKKEGKLVGITIATVPGSSRKIPREDEEDKAATSCKQRQLLKRLTLMLLQWRFYRDWVAFSQYKQSKEKKTTPETKMSVKVFRCGRQRCLSSHGDGLW